MKTIMKTITKTIATRYAMTVGLAGALALTAVGYPFAQIRTGAESGTTVSQYCAPPDEERPDAQVLLSQWGVIEHRSPPAAEGLGRVLINVQMSGFADEAEILSSTRALPVVTTMYGPAARCKRTFIELADVRSCINVSGL